MPTSRQAATIARRLVLVGVAAERHRAEPELGHPDAGLAERAVLHRIIPARATNGLGAGEVRGIDHLSIVEERQPSVGSVAFELGDQLDRVGDPFRRRRERLVDDVDLARVDGDLAGEAHRRRQRRLATQAVEVGEVR